MANWQPSPDQSRAVHPVETGYAEQGGVPLFYEVYGEGEGEGEEAWSRDPAHYRRFLERFFESFFEEHSTKPIEDGIAWGLETDAATLAATHLGWQPDAALGRELCASITCPTLVIHGARGHRRADPRGQPTPGNRSTSRASRRSTICTASRPSAAWTRS